MRKLLKILGLLAVLLVWTGVSAFGALEGWWLSPLAKRGDSESFTRVLQARLHDAEKGNAAVVLIEDGKIVFEDYSASVDDVDRDTLFPLASMSKLFTAYGALEMVSEGAISLDAPVQNRLSRWHFPTGEFDSQNITLRQLLSHTAGLTDGLGFADYSADDTLPSLTETLSHPLGSAGEKVIAPGAEPGSQWLYSGGGYLVTELLMEELSGDTFRKWMQSNVFTPLNMPRTTYAFTGDLDNHANSYQNDGTQAPLYKYAAASATGLASTPADLSVFALALIAAATSPDSSPEHQIVKNLTTPTGYTLGAPIWGVGAMLYAPLPDGEFIFGHDGSNSPAINSALRVNPQTGDGIIVLSTGREMLASDLGYEWTLWQSGYPDFLNFEGALRSAFFPTLIGYLLIIAGFTVLLLRRKR